MGKRCESGERIKLPNGVEYVVPFVEDWTPVDEENLSKMGVAFVVTVEPFDLEREKKLLHDMTGLPCEVGQPGAARVAHACKGINRLIAEVERLKKIADCYEGESRERSQIIGGLRDRCDWLKSEVEQLTKAEDEITRLGRELDAAHEEEKRLDGVIEERDGYLSQIATAIGETLPKTTSGYPRYKELPALVKGLIAEHELLKKRSTANGQHSHEVVGRLQDEIKELVLQNSRMETELQRRDDLIAAMNASPGCTQGERANYASELKAAKDENERLNRNWTYCKKEVERLTQEQYKVRLADNLSKALREVLADSPQEEEDLDEESTQDE